MKCIIKGISVDCTVEEFKQLTNQKAKEISSGIYKPKRHYKKRGSKYKLVTEEDKRQVWEMRVKGKSFLYIGRKMGRTTSSVANIMSKISTGIYLINKEKGN